MDQQDPKQYQGEDRRHSSQGDYKGDERRKPQTMIEEPEQDRDDKQQAD